MSISLDFYAVRWSDLAGAIGSRDRRLFTRVLKKTEPYFEEIYDPEDFDDGPDFELGLERWIDGDVATAGGDEPQIVDALGDALGFVALTRFYGEFAGTITHATSGGDTFRRDFLFGAAQQLLAPPYSLEHLISRPVLGFESDDFPFWGGLTREEFIRIEPRLRQEPPPWEPDPDIDVWLVDLWTALRGVAEREVDLITVYS